MFCCIFVLAVDCGVCSFFAFTRWKHCRKLWSIPRWFSCAPLAASAAADSRCVAPRYHIHRHTFPPLCFIYSRMSITIHKIVICSRGCITFEWEYGVRREFMCWLLKNISFNRKNVHRKVNLFETDRYFVEYDQHFCENLKISLCRLFYLASGPKLFFFRDTPKR